MCYLTIYVDYIVKLLCIIIFKRRYTNERYIRTQARHDLYRLFHLRPPGGGGQRDQAMPFQLKHSIRPLQRYAAGESHKRWGELRMESTAPKETPLIIDGIRRWCQGCFCSLFRLLIGRSAFARSPDRANSPRIPQSWRFPL